MDRHRGRRGRGPHGEHRGPGLPAPTHVPPVRSTSLPIPGQRHSETIKTIRQSGVPGAFSSPDLVLGRLALSQSQSRPHGAGDLPRRACRRARRRPAADPADLALAADSVSTLVNQLAGAGYLLRETDPADRRARLLPTPAAETRLREWRRHRAELVHRHGVAPRRAGPPGAARGDPGPAQAGRHPARGGRGVMTRDTAEPRADGTTPLRSDTVACTALTYAFGDQDHCHPLRHHPVARARRHNPGLRP